ncbi:MAG: rod-binding protein [Clostridia bacterium]|nr:rod-binding protein [Clostridia bacterium]
MKIDGLSTVTAGIEQSRQVSESVSDKSFEEALKKAAESGDDEQLKDACEQFESVFLNMMLQTMRKTIPESDLVEKSQGTKTFESMLDEEYSKSLAKGGGIGLADVLFNQLKKG